MKENIEEDLKKIENLIECFRKAEIINLECKESMYQICNYSHYKAIDHVISDYKRVLEENEELKQSLIINKKLYEELCNKDNELKKENELARQALKKQCDIADERNQLLKEIKELRKENKE